MIPCAALALAPPRVVVVGGGIGGLATAGRLARAGARVVVVEKNAEVGGRLGEHHWSGYRWETGASLLLLPEVYEETLRALGDEAVFETVRVRPSYAAWVQGERVDLGGGSAGNGLEEYLAIAGDYLSLGWRTFIEESFDWAAVPRLARLVQRGAWPLQSHDGFLRRLFPESPKLRALCSFNDMYVGLTPYDAPAVFSLLAAIELGDGLDEPPLRKLGVYYLAGGLAAFPRRLADACRALGVEFVMETEVATLETRARVATAAVATSGRRFEGDFYVVNADLAAAEPRLLGDDSRDSYDDWTYSTTAYVFLWAFAERLEGLAHHNVFLATDDADPTEDPFRPAWDWAFGRGNNRQVRPFHFYACAASKTDASAAPEGGESLMVLVPAPPLGDDDVGAEDSTDAIRDFVLGQLERVCDGPLPKPIYEKVLRPEDHWRQTLGLRRGAVFGFAHGLDQLGLFRPGRKTSKVANVAFVGASTRPGVATCSAAALISRRSQATACPSSSRPPSSARGKSRATSVSTCWRNNDASHELGPRDGTRP